jgi:Ras-related protein Rab-40
LQVGDNDVGKEEILNGLENDDSELTINSQTPGVNHRSTTILLDGKRIKIQLW